MLCSVRALLALCGIALGCATVPSGPIYDRLRHERAEAMGCVWVDPPRIQHGFTEGGTYAATGEAVFHDPPLVIWERVAVYYQCAEGESELMLRESSLYSYRLRIVDTPRGSFLQAY